MPVSARVTSVKALTATLSWIETMAAKYGRNISARNTLNLTMRLQTYLEDGYISQGKSLQLNPDAIVKFIIKRFTGIPKNKIRKEKSKIKKDLVSAFKAGKFK